MWTMVVTSGYYYEMKCLKDVIYSIYVSWYVPTSCGTPKIKSTRCYSGITNFFVFENSLFKNSNQPKINILVLEKGKLENRQGPRFSRIEPFDKSPVEFFIKKKKFHPTFPSRFHRRPFNLADVIVNCIPLSRALCASILSFWTPCAREARATCLTKFNDQSYYCTPLRSGVMKHNAAQFSPNVQLRQVHTVAESILKRGDLAAGEEIHYAAERGGKRRLEFRVDKRKKKKEREKWRAVA